jgi:exopolysaccharide biosynthesis polyprenyl glycosylphosphotransferase
MGWEPAAGIRKKPFYTRRIIGFLDDDCPVGGVIRGRIADLPQVARAEFVDEVIIALPCPSAVANRIIWQARQNRLDVSLIPDLLGQQSTSLTLERCGDVPLLSLYREKVPVLALVLKRSMDILLSLFGLVLGAPVMAGIALLIKLTSPGPVFYRAPRAGRKGTSFLCYKFRTMICNANDLKAGLRSSNQRAGPFFKISHDPRITRIGKFLRRYSLDEVPQLWNVLRGDMSLVGPRPHPLDDVERYSLEHLRRLDVNPGMTGLWQVTARDDPSFRRSMALDLEYIERWSLGLDLRILLKTVAVVFQGNGA